MRRACIIVDHPLRDLDGLVLLSAQLARRGIEAVLVPMYDVHEALAMRPDLVLVNYLRYANAGFVRACGELGIKVGVLDTEGGVRQDVAGFADEVAPYARDVALYCLWGRRQLQAFRERTQVPERVLRVTGCPRYDYAVKPWSEALHRHVDEAVILVNTNFVIAGPRFQTRDRELKDLANGMGYDRAWLLEVLAQAVAARAALLDVVRAVARRHPQQPVVIRPHPFEDAEFYRGELRDHPNVRVVQEGTVFEWIHTARLVIHYNCSTAIESVLMGVEPVHLDWVEAPHLRQPTPVGVSQRARSPEHLLELVDEAVLGRAIPVAPELARAREELIAEYYHRDDGGAAARVAAAVAETVGEPQAPVGRRRYALRLVRAHRTPRLLGKLVLVMAGGGRGFNLLRALAGRRERAAAKRFAVSEVQALLDRLARVEPALAGVQARAVSRRDQLVPHPGPHASVRVVA